MSYKSLNLNRDKILSALESSGAAVSVPISRGKETHFQISYPNEAIALLVFYYNADGTTTISTSRGKNNQRNEELAKIVLEKCTISNLNNISLYIKNMSDSDFNDSITYLTQECGVTLDSESQITGGKQYKCTGSKGDKLTIKYFNNHAMQVQGKPLFVYSDLMEILCELLPYEQIVKPQFETVNVQCTTDEILGELEAALPIAYRFLQDKTKAIISPALALRRIEIELEDYTAFTMPALRGLEAYLKQLFLSKSIIVDNKGFGSFLTGNKPAKLNNATATQLGCPKLVAAIEKSYNYWSVERHGLSHVDGVVATTRTISREEADIIVRNVLQVIDDSHALI